MAGLDDFCRIITMCVVKLRPKSSVYDFSRQLTPKIVSQRLKSYLFDNFIIWITIDRKFTTKVVSLRCSSLLYDCTCFKTILLAMKISDEFVVYLRHSRNIDESFENDIVVV